MDKRIMNHFRRLQKAQVRKERDEKSRAYYNAEGQDLQALNTWDRSGWHLSTQGKGKEQEGQAYRAAEEEVRRRQEAEKMEQAYKAAEEEARRRQEAEEMEQAYKAAEEEARRRQEAEEIEQAYRAAEEEARRRQEEELKRGAEAATEMRKQREQRNDSSVQWSAGEETHRAHWWGKERDREDWEECRQSKNERGQRPATEAHQDYRQHRNREGENGRHQTHRGGRQSNKPYSATRGRDMKKNERLAQAIKAGKNAVIQYSLRWQKLRLLEPTTRIWSFRDIPWPLLQPPSQPADIKKEKIGNFYLDPNIKGKVDRQAQIKVIKQELMHWHPDKFNSMILPLVHEDQLQLVEEGLHLVSSTLTELLNKLKEHT